MNIYAEQRTLNAQSRTGSTTDYGDGGHVLGPPGSSHLVHTSA